MAIRKTYFKVVVVILGVLGLPVVFMSGFGDSKKPVATLEESVAGVGSPQTDKKLSPEMPLYPDQANRSVTRSIGAYDARPDGDLQVSLTGSGVVVGIWDVGRPRATHQEFGSRVSYVDTPVISIDGHSTAMTGTVAAAGVDPEARGFAPDVTVRAYAASANLTNLQTAASDGLRISYHPYFYSSGWAQRNLKPEDDPTVNWAWFGDALYSESEDIVFGSYRPFTAEWDNIAHQYPQHVIIKAAGNQRGFGPESQPVEHWFYDPDDGYSIQLSTTVRGLNGGEDGFDVLSFGSVAKNPIVVGNANLAESYYGHPGQVEIASSSGRGPTDDGRIKPDITAPSNIAKTTGSSSSNVGYTTGGGTSSSTAVVAGTAVLILELYRELYGADPLGSTYKALLVHTAHETGTGPGPDYTFGWGFLNASGAIRYLQAIEAVGGRKGYGISPTSSSGSLNEHRSDFVHEEATLHTGNTHTYSLYHDGNGPLKFTIAWTDPAGTPLSYNGDLFDNRTPMLVNDLDLRVTAPSSGTWLPWALDPDNPQNDATRTDNIVDNVEQVFVPDAEAGFYTVTVSHKGTLSGGSQVYSLFGGPASPSVRKLTTANSGWRLISVPFPGMSYRTLNETFFTQAEPGNTWALAQSTATNLLRWELADPNDEHHPGSGFRAVSSEGGFFEPGHGYLFYIFESNPSALPERDWLPATWINYGARTENVDIPISGPTNEINFFLAGNPYEYPVDWRLVLDESEGLSTSIAIWDPQDVTGGGTSGYRYFSSVLDLDDDEPIIAPNTGFFVQLVPADEFDEASEGVLRFRREHIVRSGTTSFFGKSPPQPKPAFSSLRFSLSGNDSGGELISNAGIFWHPEGRDGLDRLDVLRGMPLGEPELELNFVQNSHKLVYEVRREDELVREEHFEAEFCSARSGRFHLNTHGREADIEFRKPGQTDLILPFGRKLYTTETIEVEFLKAGCYAVGLVISAPEPLSFESPHETLPLETGISGNYPNPFNPVTTVTYTVGGGHGAKPVTLTMYDLLGRRVQEMVNEFLPEGKYSVTLDASTLSSGIYILQLNVSGEIHTHKITLLK